MTVAVERPHGPAVFDSSGVDARSGAEAQVSAAGTVGAEAWNALQSLVGLPDRDLLVRALPQGMPGYLIRRAESASNASFEAHTQQSDLTPRQFGFLQTLSVHGSIQQNELRDRLHLDRSTMADLVRRLAARGLVVRRTSVADRRTSELLITEEGQALVEATVRGAVTSQIALLDPLPPYLRPLFMACLTMVVEGTGAPSSLANETSTEP